MKTETREELNRIISDVEQLRADVYDYDYDREVLWYIDEAIRNLKNA